MTDRSEDKPRRFFLLGANTCVPNSAYTEQRKINFFNRKLGLANSNTPKKHLKRWLKERNMAQDRLSIITQGAG